jgi:hypothetical protein
VLRGQVHTEPHQLPAPRGIDQTAVLDDDHWLVVGLADDAVPLFAKLVAVEV